ncbi:hypothetical protein [Nostoc sp.]|uniref:hypothetical protein n=1 Tax=Nostoc sp. TaxID=1180 RepID=UPI002FF937E4
MDFWDGVRKGAFWGLCLGIGLCIIATLLDLFSNEAGVTDPTTVVIYVILLGIIGTVLGCTVALIIEGIIGSLKFLNWLFILLGGSLLTILTALMGGMVGWLSITLIPILFFLRQYLSEKSPKWIEEALNKAIVMFLYSISLTFLVFCFEKTGITLRGLPL